MIRKRIAIATIIFSPFALNAQAIDLPGGGSIDSELVKIGASILVLYLLTVFILSVIRTILDYRLRSRMVEKGVSDLVIEQFLQPRNKDAKTQAIKSFLIFLAIAIGLTIINFTTPFGIHSVAIMAFCISLGFLVYFYYLRTTIN